MKKYLTPSAVLTAMTSSDIITESSINVELAFDNQLDVWDMNVSISNS